MSEALHPVVAPPAAAAVPPVVTPPVEPVVAPVVAPVAAAPDPSPLGVQPEGEATASAPEGAPEKYEFTLPDKFEVDATQMTAFQELAREANLPQAAAQKLLDLYTAQMTASATAQQAAWDGMIDGWKGEFATAFPGAKLTEAQVVVARALDEYGGSEVRKAFDLTGAGWNPSIFGMIHKMALALNEGTITPAGGPPSPPKSGASVLYSDPPQGT